MANGAVIAIVVIIIVILLVGLVVGIYYLTRKKSPTKPPPTNLPPSGNGVTGTRILLPPPTANGTNIPPVNFTPPPPSIGPTGPTCPSGPGGTAPEGCSACSTPGIFLCPASVLQPFNYSQNGLISCFRLPQYDPSPVPPITLGGKGYFFREYNNSCPA